MVNINGWRLGLSICYDLRFPVFFQSFKEVDAILIPSAFTVPTGSAHWEVLLRARAIENQSYVIASAQSGYPMSLRYFELFTYLCIGLRSAQ